jgi:hypothetical protein
LLRTGHTYINVDLNNSHITVEYLLIFQIWPPPTIKHASEHVNMFHDTFCSFEVNNLPCTSHHTTAFAPCNDTLLAGWFSSLQIYISYSWKHNESKWRKVSHHKQSVQDVSHSAISRHDSDSLSQSTNVVWSVQ